MAKNDVLVFIYSISGVLICYSNWNIRDYSKILENSSRVLIIVLALGLIVYWNVSFKYCVQQPSNGSDESIKQTSALGQKYHVLCAIPLAEPPMAGGDACTDDLVNHWFKVQKLRYKIWVKIIFHLLSRT